MGGGVRVRAPPASLRASESGMAASLCMRFGGRVGSGSCSGETRRKPSNHEDHTKTSTRGKKNPPKVNNMKD